MKRFALAFILLLLVGPSFADPTNTFTPTNTATATYTPTPGPDMIARESSLQKLLNAALAQSTAIINTPIPTNTPTWNATTTPTQPATATATATNTPRSDEMETVYLPSTISSPVPGTLQIAVTFSQNWSRINCHIFTAGGAVTFSSTCTPSISAFVGPSLLEGVRGFSSMAISKSVNLGRIGTAQGCNPALSPRLKKVVFFNLENAVFDGLSGGIAQPLTIRVDASN